MKVTGSTSSAATGSARAPRQAAAGGGFAPAIGEVQETAGPAGAGGVKGVSSIEALIALQSVDGPLERRRRAVRRGGRLLDLLGDIKLGLLDGALPAASLDRLSHAVREERSEVEDPGLQGVLDEIETRALVELAKLDMARARQAAA